MNENKNTPSTLSTSQSSCSKQKKCLEAANGSGQQMAVANGKLNALRVYLVTLAVVLRCRRTESRLLLRNPNRKQSGQQEEIETERVNSFIQRTHTHSWRNQSKTGTILPFVNKKKKAKHGFGCKHFDRQGKMEKIQVD